METGQVTQAVIDIIDGSGDITDVIGNPINSSEGFLDTILNNPIRLRGAIIISFFRIVALIRTIKDSNARSSSFRFLLLSALIVMILGPIFGLLLYIAIRPQGWKWDKTPWRNVSFQNIQVCDNCGNFNHLENNYCIHCGECLQSECRECQSIYPKSYSYCPDCGAPNLQE